MPNYYDFYAVMESDVDSSTMRNSFEILNEGKIGGNIDFFRYKACLMSVGKRNRNRRLWQKQHIDVMMNAPHIVEQFKFAGGLPGENGHPIPATGPVTMERIVTIDPNNLAILIKDWWWEGNKMMGTVETLNEGPGTPGFRLMRDMMQGIIPAHSARTLVPQRRNPDGSIDVTAPGRFVTVDRVHGPSCEEAYRDVSIPVKNIVKKAEFDSAMENFTSYVLEHSEAAKRVIDDMRPAMETASITKDGMFTVATESSGQVFVPVERNLRADIADFMRNL